MTDSKNRRSQYFIEKKIQSKILFAGSVVALTLASTTAALLFVGKYSKTDFQSGPILDLAALSVVTVFVILMMVVIGVRMLHRIVGPVSALNRHLKLIAEGVYHQNLTLRETDEFQHMAQNFNDALSALRLRSKASVDLCRKNIKKIDEIEASLKSGSFDPDLTAAELEKIRKDLGELLEQNDKHLTQQD